MRSETRSHEEGAKRACVHYCVQVCAYVSVAACVNVHAWCVCGLEINVAYFALCSW